ncbi:MSC2 [Candida pseudojiufengensis]|uniref:MSC2 n=1 Tax=Candida pseudojiufengensis TaxID=497109 RepID=UPI0022244FFA|nr:MSC2 [Candida pseudojiufengensis]KAI5965864.1 MSC2 [Candida pseudojiufengensis]
MENNDIPYQLNTNNKFEKISNTFSSIKNGQNLSNQFTILITTLPLLIAYPIVFLSYELIINNSALQTNSSDHQSNINNENYYTLTYQLFINSLVAFILSSFTVLCIYIAQFIKLIPSQSTNTEIDISESRKHTIKLLIATFLIYLPITFIEFDKVNSLLFGLFINYRNYYTPVIIISDLIKSLSIIKLVGYVLLFSGFYTLTRVNFKLKLDKIIISVLTMSSLILILFFYQIFNFSMIGVHLITFIISIITFQEFSNHSNKIHFIFLSVINSILRYVVLQKLDFYTILNIVLSILIIPGSSYNFYQLNQKYTTSTTNTTSTTTTTTSNTSTILGEVLKHQDTKAIFNFLLLNASFMIIQFLYSFRSKSLGLLSDSLHMLLDCISLALGLIAGVLSKMKVNKNGKYPFGWSNLENLAGFTNATLLMGISGSILFEAIGRLFNPIHLQKTNELMVVSILGLLVNLVGVFAFNHGHSHGHGHGHSHNHSHSHTLDTHSHSHDHSHNHTHSSHQAELNEPNEDDKQKINDNMRGIFLHILADALGSVGVVISTLLTKIFNWQGFDPIASLIIAILIFLSSIPLMKSTSSTLLLNLSHTQESKIRLKLNEISSIKGIKSITTPRFWPKNGNESQKLCGYLHVQIYRGENSSYLKKQIEKIFKLEDCFDDDILIQIENDYDDCWCRKKQI